MVWTVANPLRSLGHTVAGGGSVAAPTITVVNNDDGTATVTISGSTAGTTNTAWFAQIDGDFGSSLTWSNGGSRTSDGTIVVTPGVNGVFWFYVHSTAGTDTEVSNPVYQAVSSGVESVWNQILDAIQARIRSMSLSGIASSRVRVLTQMDPDEVRAIFDSTGGIIVAPAGAETVREGDNQTDDLDYPVVCALVVAANRDADNRDLRETWMLHREKVRRSLLNQPLSTPNANIFGASLRTAPPVDQAAWRQMGLVSPVSLAFWSNESRGI